MALVRALRLFLCVLVAGIVLGTGVAASAGAAVTLAGGSPSAASSCAAGSASASLILFSTPFDIAAPTGAQTGDLLVLALRSENESSFLAGFTLPEARGWTLQRTDGNVRIYTRLRLPVDGSTYRLVSSSGIVSASVDLAATITAFRGADPVSPIAAGSSTSSGTGTGSVPLPDAAAPRAGSYRWSPVTTSRSMSVDATAAAPLTKACGATSTAASAAGLVEPVTGTVTTTRAVAIAGSGTPSWRAHTLVIQPEAACASGPGGLSAPSSIAFPSRTLDGYDQTIDTTVSVTVDDESGLAGGLGWRLQGTSTPFVNGAHQLPSDAVTITAATPTLLVGGCLLPVNATAYPRTLPAGSPAPAAADLASAALGTGLGPVRLDLTARLAVPADARAGAYSSTWTLSLVSGP